MLTLEELKGMVARGESGGLTAAYVTPE